MNATPDRSWADSSWADLYAMTARLPRDLEAMSTAATHDELNARTASLLLDAAAALANQTPELAHRIVRHAAITYTAWVAETTRQNQDADRDEWQAATAPDLADELRTEGITDPPF